MKIIISLCGPIYVFATIYDLAYCHGRTMRALAGMTAADVIWALNVF